MANQLIAISGKGGVGKTTIAAFLVRLLTDNGMAPVLAVDADPNNTLAPLLGLEPTATMSDIRDDILKEKARQTGVPKERLLEMRLEECIQESHGFDLLTMGRPEGPDCYCYVNNLLRGALTRLRSNYPVTVVDNEAGMEHMSRMNTNNIDCLVLVAEPTAISARAVARIATLASSLPVTVRRKLLVWNKVRPGGVPSSASEVLADVAVDAVIQLPADDTVAQLSTDEDSVYNTPIPEAFLPLVLACMGHTLEPVAAM